MRQPRETLNGNCVRAARSPMANAAGVTPGSVCSRVTVAAARLMGSCCARNAGSKIGIKWMPVGKSPERRSTKRHLQENEALAIAARHLTTDRFTRMKIGQIPFTYHGVTRTPEGGYNYASTHAETSWALNGREYKMTITLVKDGRHVPWSRRAVVKNLAGTTAVA
jgi:hypothetical protein